MTTTPIPDEDRRGHLLAALEYGVTYLVPRWDADDERTKP